MSTEKPTMNELRLVQAKDFKAERTGRFYRAGNGKLKEETVGVEYFHTAGAGCLRAEAVIRANYVAAPISIVTMAQLADVVAI